MILFIRHMVSQRCAMLVRNELDQLNISYNSVKLGEVDLVHPIGKNVQHKLNDRLLIAGLEIIEDKSTILVEKIETIIVEMVHHSKDYPTVNFSVFLCQKLNLDYHKMAEIFSKVKGITIEHFIILQKVEKIKELISYDELNLTEISYRLNYSSVAHLSKQFKDITRLTPTQYKKQNNCQRKNLEDL